MSSRADSPTKMCTKPGCGKALRARGLCSTHYNRQHQPHRHALRVAACTVCGTPVLRPAKADRRPACSIECRRVIQFGAEAEHGAGYDWATDAARRARLAGATVIEPFDRTEVFERDGWLCYLCEQPTDQDATPFDRAYPTVDHVVPLSRGGQHTLANVRTACLGCNSAKQDHEEWSPAA